jgi:DNA uptake protein ComE-like DNA-binding protein
VSIWTAGHRRVVLGVIVILAAFLIVESFRQPVLITDPPTTGVRAAEVQDKLDPNTATAADLAAIAGLGEGRAHALVEYRQDFLRRHPSGVAFARPEDLLLIHGIGPSTMKNLEPYLVFPAAKR